MDELDTVGGAGTTGETVCFIIDMVCGDPRLVKEGEEGVMLEPYVWLREGGIEDSGGVPKCDTKCDCCCWRDTQPRFALLPNRVDPSVAIAGLCPYAPTPEDDDGKGPPLPDVAGPRPIAPMLEGCVRAPYWFADDIGC